MINTLTQDELSFLNKVNSQIVDYSKLGFNQYGVRVGVSANPLLDQDENSIRTSTILNGAVTDEKIETLSVGKLLAGTIVVSVNVGNGNCKIDGSANRFMVNDGTNDRCLLGELVGKF